MSVAAKLFKLPSLPSLTDCLPLARKMLAIVALSLALDRADAGEPLTGSATDGHLVVEWEYDLEMATAELTIENINADNQGYVFGIDGLIPDGASNLKCNGIPSVLQECAACPASAVFCPSEVLFRYVPPGNSVQVSFNLPEANWVTTLGMGDVTYAPGYMFSAGYDGMKCTFLSASTIDGFVTVTPMAQGCLNEDSIGISPSSPSPTLTGSTTPSNSNNKESRS